MADVVTDRTVYEIIGADRRRLIGGIWLSLATCQTVCDDLNGSGQVHAVPVNDGTAP